jgi:cyclophilin family peptidyl-prolyl cis-trans isomerase
VFRRILSVTLMIVLIAGMAFAQDKVAESAKKVEKSMTKKNPIVEIKTNLGSFYLEVFENETPVHAKNFLSKVDAGKYDGLTFHRVVAGFVIQGGDPTGTGSGSMGEDRLADETSPYPQMPGTVAMARSQMGASNCQFYVNLKDNTFLDKQKFSSFAKVVQGMDVVNKIAAVPVGAGDKPTQPVTMIKLSRVDKLPDVQAAKVAPKKDATEPK